jgi:hypothetical protein
MNKAPLIERAREAFAAYRGLGREIIDELIFALTVANTEVGRIRASHDRLLAAAKRSRLVMKDIEVAGPNWAHVALNIGDLQAAIAAAEELEP